MALYCLEESLKHNAYVYHLFIALSLFYSGYLFVRLHVWDILGPSVFVIPKLVSASRD